MSAADYAANRQAFETYLDVLRKTLYLPDSVVPTLQVVLATLVANRLPGIAVWVALIAPSSAGKTSIFLDPLSALPCTYDLDDVTLAGLLLGKKSGPPGLLRATREGDVLLLKDLSVLMGLGPEQQRQVYAAQRRIFEGSYKRSTGEGTFEFRGKRGLLAAGTGEVYRWVEAQGELGERIIRVLHPEFTQADRDARSIAARRSERRMAWDDMVAERATAAMAWHDTLALPDELPYPDDPANLRIQGWAEIGARLRSTVRRDPGTRDIEEVPTPEEPTRLQESLDQLTGALMVVGASPSELGASWRACALGGCRPDRLRVVLALLDRHRQDKGWAGLTTTAVTGFARLGSDSNAQRHLENLSALEVVDRHGSGHVPDPFTWRLSGWFMDRWNAANAIGDAAELVAVTPIHRATTPPTGQSRLQWDGVDEFEGMVQ